MTSINLCAFIASGMRNMTMRVLLYIIVFRLCGAALSDGHGLCSCHEKCNAHSGLQSAEAPPALNCECISCSCMSKSPKGGAGRAPGRRRGELLGGAGRAPGRRCGVPGIVLWPSKDLLCCALWVSKDLLCCALWASWEVIHGHSRLFTVDSRSFTVDSRLFTVIHGFSRLIHGRSRPFTVIHA